MKKQKNDVIRALVRVGFLEALEEGLGENAACSSYLSGVQ